MGGAYLILLMPLNCKQVDVKNTGARTKGARF